MKDTLPIVDEYHCPDELHPVSRAIHLGRLAAFYPACRDCPRRDDLESFSPTLREQLLQSFRPRELPPQLDGDSLVIAAGRDAARYARSAAQSFADYLSTCGESEVERRVSIFVANDGRGEAAELLKELSDGVRFMGAAVVELGATTAPCMAYAIAETNSAGGIYLSSDNDGRASELRFWRANGQPITQSSGLEQIVARMNASHDRPSRQFAAASRSNYAEQYLLRLRPVYHALRPLQIAIETRCRPLVRMLNGLTSTVGCRLSLVGKSTRAPTKMESRPDANESMHFGIWIDGRGEAFRLFDEQSRLIDTPATVRLLHEAIGSESVTAAAIVVDCDCRIWLPADTLSQLDAGAPTLPCPAPDALLAFTLLLKLLSRSDRPISSLVAPHAAR